MLAWTCTAHKVQRLSLPKIVVSFGLQRRRNSIYGQIYVALSRMITIEGLSLTRSVSAAARPTGHGRILPNAFRKCINGR